MDAEELIDNIRRSTQTELNRLGSQKVLIAHTDANLERETILGVAANREYAAFETFRQWEEETSDDRTRMAIRTAADQAKDNYDRISERLLDGFEPESADPLHSAIREREETIDRVAAGFIAEPLVEMGTLTQIIGFFINEADQSTADLFRDIKTGRKDMMDEGEALLDTLCESSEDWTQAKQASEAVIYAAYDEYLAILENMGINPKPVC